MNTTKLYRSVLMYLCIYISIHLSIYIYVYIHIYREQKHLHTLTAYKQQTQTYEELKQTYEYNKAVQVCLYTCLYAYVPCSFCIYVFFIGFLAFPLLFLTFSLTLTLFHSHTQHRLISKHASKHSSANSKISRAKTKITNNKRNKPGQISEF